MNRIKLMMFTGEYNMGLQDSFFELYIPLPRILEPESLFSFLSLHSDMYNKIIVIQNIVSVANLCNIQCVMGPYTRSG